MSMVNSVLALLKMEVSELIREASITDSISPRSPTESCKVYAKEGSSCKTIVIDHKLPTVGHEVHHQFGVRNVAAAHRGPTVPFTFCRVYTSHHIWIETEKISSMA